MKTSWRAMGRESNDSRPCPSRSCSRPSASAGRQAISGAPPGILSGGHSSYTVVTLSLKLPPSSFATQLSRQPVEANHVQGRRHRSRHHQLSRLGARGGRARRHPQRRGRPHDPLGRRVLEDRRGPRRRGRQAPGDHQPRPHDPFGQAPHGHRLEDRHRRQGVQRAGDQRPHPA